MEKDKTPQADNVTVRDIILWNRIGRMVPIIAQKLQVSIEEAFDVFYTSETCARLHDEQTGLYLYGDLYIIEDLMMELDARGKESQNQPSHSS